MTFPSLIFCQQAYPNYYYQNYPAPNPGYYYQQTPSQNPGYYQQPPQQYYPQQPQWSPQAPVKPASNQWTPNATMPLPTNNASPTRIAPVSNQTPSFVPNANWSPQQPVPAQPQKKPPVIAQPVRIQEGPGANQDPPPPAPVPTLPPADNNFPAPSPNPGGAPKDNPNAVPNVAPPTFGSPLNAPPPLPPMPMPAEGPIFNPMRKGNPYTKPGFYGALEVGLLKPNLNGQLSATVPVNGNNVPVSLTPADLPWTGSPRLELGYRFAGGAGGIVGAYRSVVAEGSDTIPNFDAGGNAQLDTRLNMNIIDIKYASNPMEIAHLWDLTWGLGVRIGAVYFDNQASGNIIQQRTSSNFIGAGPLLSFDLERRFQYLDSLAIFGHIDGAVVIGGVDQSFNSVQQTGGTPIGGAVNVNGSTSVPVLGLQFGLSYSPKDQSHWMRFRFGYQFEQWWNVGNVADSTGDVSFQGLFFRGEFNF